MDLRTLQSNAPVTFIETDQVDKQPQEGVALCLSGGGYRAMVFHLGALIRLNEAGILKSLVRISSVSGGSIAAGVLGLKWKRLNFSNGVASNLFEEVVEPICQFASIDLDWIAVLEGLPSANVAGKVASTYDKFLFGGATLQDLPSDNEGPRFVINSTNVQTGVLWRFSKPFMADYRVGMVPYPKLSLATAVAASSAFPPFLSPLILNLKHEDFTPDPTCPLQKEPYTTRVVLTDGGVYDNLGLETAWKSYKTILVSDGGAKIPDQPKPKRSWFCHVRRVVDIIDNQVGNLRKRQLVGSYISAGPDHREGTYWGIRSHVKDFELPDAMECPERSTKALAEIPTRLLGIKPKTQEKLINWGYAICDTALRKHYIPSQPKGHFPFPTVGL